MSIKISELKEIFEDLEAYKELANIIIPEMSNYVDRLSDGVVDLKIRQIARYQAAGYTREEAILMTIDTTQSLREAFKNNNS